jgi:serine/threonine protein kinase/Leucine-rich repeat (LRR) protein
METRNAEHPSDDMLKALGQGKLDEGSTRAVIEHLNLCTGCRKAASLLAGDASLERLLQAQGRIDTPAPAHSLSATDPRPNPPLDRTTLFNVPPELADNPNYEILRELGRGGMGVVYQAKNKLMDRVEVLKVINQRLLDRPGSVDRFLREIRSVAKLNHSNVVAAYSALQLGELLVFAMEYVEGQDLAGFVKAIGPLPVPHACFYTQQAALGLQHAFENGMVHRDIKPQNLMLARRGVKHIVKVLDFGLAKVVREKIEDPGLTGEGRMLGTPDYMAPEQILDAASADIRADIYSLGCTLYFLLSGKPPFKGRSPYEIFQAHQSMDAPSVNDARPDAPVELAQVVRKMMAKDRSQRYQTPLEVVRALSPFIQQSRNQTPAEASFVASTGSRAAAESKPSAPSGAASTAREALTASDSRTPRSSVIRKPRVLGISAASSKKVWIIAGVAGSLLVVGLLSLLAGGVLRVKTKQGTIVLDNLPADAEVLVDGEVVTLKLSDGKPLVVGITPGKRHWLEVKKEGFKVFGEEVEIDAGDQRAVAVRLERIGAPAEPTPAGDAAANKNRLVPLDPAWLQKVPGLSAEEQVKEVSAELRRRNPNFEGNVKHESAGGAVIALWFLVDNVTDISPVSALSRLKKLSCVGNSQGQGKLADLTPLQGMDLVNLDCSMTQVADLRPLKGMKLRTLALWVTSAGDLTPLKGMPLEDLNLGGAQTADLTPLRGMPLRTLIVNSTRVKDLGPLKGMELENLNILGTAVADLSPLSGMPLLRLSCNATQIDDLTPLKSTKLVSLDCNATRVKDLTPLKGLKLTVLGLHFTHVEDISALKGMPLTYLNCQGLPITDLSVVKGMPLTTINIAGTRVADLSPLGGTPLQELYFDYTPKRGDKAVLDSIKTLAKINGKPTAEFWKQAGEVPPKR